MPEYFAPEVIEQFEARTGLEVEQVYYESLGQMMGMLQSHPDRYDLVTTDDVSIAELSNVKIISEIDHEKIPNFENLDERYLDQHFDPKNQFSIPYVWGTTLIAYRTDRIDPELSWNLLWDPELKGKIAMMDERADIYAAALLTAGHPLNSQTPAHLEEATDLLVQQTKELDPLYTDLYGGRDKMLAGEIWAMITYSCDAAMIAVEDENIGYFIPEEGAPLWLDSFAILRHAPNRDAAHAFIDFLCEPEVAAENANYVWYIPPVKGVEPFLNEDLVADLALNPSDEIVDKCAFHASPTPARERIVNRGMKTILDGVRAQGIANVEHSTESSSEQD
ncbi:MAG: spermidine/putrescine ABC transporter substrate-binding protein [Verrucomicrobiota bacterium]